MTHLSKIQPRIRFALLATGLLLYSGLPSSFADESPPSPEEVYETFRQQILEAQPEGENAWPRLAEVAEQLRAWTQEHRDAHFASIYDPEYLWGGDDDPIDQSIRRDTQIVFDKAIAADLPAVILGLAGQPIVFPFDPEGSMPFLEQGRQIRELSSFLHAVGHFRLQEGDADGWLETVKAALSLADATATHPTVLPMLIAMADRDRDINQVHHALTQDHLSRQILADLAGVLSSVDAVSSKSAIRTDRKLTYAMLARYFDEEGEVHAKVHEEWASEASQVLRSFGIHARAEMCRGRTRFPSFDEVGSWFNQVATQIDHLHELPATELPEFEPFIERPECTAFAEIAHSMGSAYRQAVIVARRHEVRYTGVRFAVALERYRAANDAYPAALEDLVPDFLDEIPRDPFTGQPFGYRVTTDAENAPAGYVLYSFGGNGTDNGGRACEADSLGWNIDFDYECDVVLSQRSRQ